MWRKAYIGSTDYMHMWRVFGSLNHMGMLSLRTEIRYKGKSLGSYLVQDGVQKRSPKEATDWLDLRQREVGKLRSFFENDQLKVPGGRTLASHIATPQAWPFCLRSLHVVHIHGQLR